MYISVCEYSQNVTKNTHNPMEMPPVMSFIAKYAPLNNTHLHPDSPTKQHVIQHLHVYALRVYIAVKSLHILETLANYCVTRATENVVHVSEFLRL